MQTAPFVTINGKTYTVTPTLDLSNIGYNSNPTKNGTSIIDFPLDSVLQNSAAQLCGEIAHCQTMTLTFFAQLNYTYKINYLLKEKCSTAACLYFQSSETTVSLSNLETLDDFRFSL